MTKLIENLMDNFANALISADFKYIMKTEEKDDSWRESSLTYLSRKMKRHSIQLSSLIADADADFGAIARKATDVLLYSLMISERAKELKRDGEAEEM